MRLPHWLDRLLGIQRPGRPASPDNIRDSLDYVRRTYGDTRPPGWYGHGGRYR